MTVFILPVFAAVSAFLLSLAGCELVKHTGVVDAPDGKRKQQARPVPRLGGVGMIAAILIVLAAVALAHESIPAARGHDWLPGQLPTLWVALGGAGLLAGVGALDDIFGLRALPKLLMVLAIALACALLGVAAPMLDTPAGTLAWPPLLIAGSMLWIIVVTNAANFMDGSNGLSLGSLAIMFAGLGASHAAVSDAGFPPGLVTVIAAIAGFLCHNLKGTLYAGDTGAFGLGGLFAMLALIAGIPVWTAATLVLPFLVDVLLTLASRSRHGQSLFVAHTDHAYQGLIRAGWPHMDVALTWWCLSAACAVAATIGVSAGGALPFVLFWVLVAGLSAGWFMVHRKTSGHKVTRGTGGQALGTTPEE
ncbi:glycosyltransferase family 4 protein [Henriciella sp.]|uniref:glycosyltransferase family 4 protein n=1 Tax=Henriciella sp. TaxID=1968823 RepID=UPI002639D74D|nr:MraY family glycosyltransferase [Henriciella sp.]